MGHLSRELGKLLECPCERAPLPNKKNCLECHSFPWSCTQHIYVSPRNLIELGLIIIWPIRMDGDKVPYPVLKKTFCTADHWQTPNVCGRDSLWISEWRLGSLRAIRFPSEHWIDLPVNCDRLNSNVPFTVLFEIVRRLIYLTKCILKYRKYYDHIKIIRNTKSRILGFAVLMVSDTVRMLCRWCLTECGTCYGEENSYTMLLTIVVL